MKNVAYQGDIVKVDRHIYTASEFAKENLLFLQEIGESRTLRPHVSTHDGLPSYLFFIVTKGSGTFSYQDTTYQNTAYQNTTYHLSQGDCVFADCRRIYSHCSSNDLWELKWIHFFGHNMDGVYKKYVELGGMPAFKSENAEVFLQLWEQILQYASSNPNTLAAEMGIYHNLAMLVSVLLSKHEHITLPPHSGNKAKYLQEIKKYLEEHWTEKISLDFLSSRFFIDKFYLTRLFKKVFGMSITNYLLLLRITHAKELLRFTNLSIEEISARCGISDPNYFSRVFKKIEGTTPGQFRKMW